MRSAGIKEKSPILSGSRTSGSMVHFNVVNLVLGQPFARRRAAPFSSLPCAALNNDAVSRDRHRFCEWVALIGREKTRVGNENIACDVVINIAPAVQAVVITMLGKKSVVTADANGNITITPTVSPTYVRADGK
jgi:hypothetical protein